MSSRSSKFIEVFAVTLLACASMVGATCVAAAQAWHKTGEEEGVVLETRDVPGMAMPEFRGTTVVNAGFYLVAAVLDDLDRYCEWQQRCVKAKEVSRISELERIFYSRTGAPWPLQDRDTVVHGKSVGLAEGQQAWVRFEALTDTRWPPVSGVVRMPYVKGHWHLVRIDDSHTRVAFQVQADPGGLVPAWAAKLSARQVPRDTLAGLRRQVAKSPSRYQAFLARWRDKSETPPAVTPQLQGSPDNSSPSSTDPECALGYQRGFEAWY